MLISKINFINIFNLIKLYDIYWITELYYNDFTYIQ